MMEVTRISDQLKRAFTGSAWHGPSVMEVLQNVTASKAAAKPASGAHSIWEITLHIAAWESAVVTGLRGGSTYLTDEEDWPKVRDVSEEAWQQTLTNLSNGNATLLSEISKLSDEKLNEIAGSEKKQTYYVMLHGVIQHDLYHAGQIAVLKKS
jgi:uncharacterized damage-inducible protein DinB